MTFRLKWRLIGIMILLAIDDDDIGTISELKSINSSKKKTKMLVCFLSFHCCCCWFFILLLYNCFSLTFCRHRHHHHHHHHHNGRKKRHKRKILVHDIDEQVVKVSRLKCSISKHSPTFTCDAHCEQKTFSIRNDCFSLFNSVIQLWVTLGRIYWKIPRKTFTLFAFTTDWKSMHSISFVE